MALHTCISLTVVSTDTENLPVEGLGYTLPINCPVILQEVILYDWDCPSKSV